MDECNSDCGLFTSDTGLKTVWDGRVVPIHEFHEKLSALKAGLRDEISDHKETLEMFRRASERAARYKAALEEIVEKELDCPSCCAAEIAQKALEQPEIKGKTNDR